MDTIWDLVKAQPITNRLYEMNKAVEEAAAPENQAMKKSGQIPPVPIKELSPSDGPAYSVTLSQDAKEASVQKKEPAQSILNETTNIDNKEA